jgi:hypothetical protein
MLFYRIVLVGYSACQAQVIELPQDFHVVYSACPLTAAGAAIPLGFSPHLLATG